MPSVLREEDFPYPTEKSLSLEHEQDLRRIARETGARRCSEIERERRQKERSIFLDEVSPSPMYNPKPRDAPAPKPPKPIKPKRAKAPDGYVTITDLAKSWDIPASECRAMLRASSLTKPEYGWAFPKKDVPKIKKICGVK